MNLDIAPFRLEAPKVDDDKLAEGFSASATNARVLSGSLEPWRQDTEQVDQPVTKWDATIEAVANPDAELPVLAVPGTPEAAASWTNVLGTLQVNDNDFIDGTQSFSGSDDDDTEAYQQISVAYAAGRRVRLVYARTSDEADGTTGGRAAMAIRQYSAADALLEEDLDAFGANGTRTITTDELHADTAYIRIVQLFERTGTGPGIPDARIDSIVFSTLDLATIRSIHLMDVDGDDGGPYLLQWKNDTQVSRALVRNASNVNARDQTIFTEEGEVPRITTIGLAQNAPGKDEQGLPHDWFPLGVPTPVVAPVVTPGDSGIADTENSIQIANPDAESPITVPDWNDITGTLSRSAVDPLQGTNSFVDSGDPDTESYQDIPVDPIPDRRIRLTFERESDPLFPASGGRARMEVRLLDENKDPIMSEEDVPVPLVYDSGFGADGVVDFTTEGLTDTTVYVRIVQIYEYSGVGDSAKIDTINMFSVDPGDTVFDGNSLDGLTVLRNDPRLTLFGGNFRFSTSHNSELLLYKDFNLNAMSSYTTKIRFKHRAFNTVGNCNIWSIVGADATGAGALIWFQDTGRPIELHVTENWRYTGSAYYTSSISTKVDYWYLATITVIRQGGKQRITVTVEWDDDPNHVGDKWDKVPLGEDPEDDSFSFTTELLGAEGDYIAHGAWRYSQTEGVAYIDYIRFSSTLRALNSETGDELLTYSNYVYTWYNSLFGFHSAPSDASLNLEIGLNHETSITLTNPAPSGYGIDYWYLWRLVTGSDGTTDYRLVAAVQISVDGYTYLDTKDDSELARDILPSLLWEEPPGDGHSIVAAANEIAYLASGNQVFPSPVGEPHAYPSLWAKTTDYDVVTLKAVAADVYALTQAHPYVITGSDPSVLDMEKLTKPIGCVSRRSAAVDTRLGVVYAASDGLAFANRADNGLITGDLFSEDEWAEYLPEEITGIIYDNNYIGFNSQFGFFIDLIGGTGVSRLDFVATAMDINPITGNLHMIVGTQHLTFNTAAAMRTYDWFSKVYLANKTTSFAQARIQFNDRGAGGVTLKIYYDGVEVFSRTVTSAAEFNLPDKSASHTVQVRLIGAQGVRRLKLVEATRGFLS